MKNNEYWKMRFEEHNKIMLKPIENYLNELEDYYKTALKRINNDLASWYLRFAENNGIVYIAHAKAYLNNNDLMGNEPENLKMQVPEYI